MPDAVVELWQADAGGALPRRAAAGFGRCLTDAGGRYRFTTVKPGPVDGVQAPHLDLSIFARGLLQRLVTRVYFPDEAAANAADPVLPGRRGPGAARRRCVATAGSRRRAT